MAISDGTLVIAIMACWRVTALIVYDSGPFEMFSRLREFAGLEYDHMGNVVDARNGLLKGVACVWCVSVWVALAQLALFLAWGETALLVVSLPFALSMGAIILDRLVG